MQENIYDILSRHFLGQATGEEESLIETYKAENAREYRKLKEFFEYRDFPVHQLDSNRAWARVMRKYHEKTSSRKKSRSTYILYTRIAAAALLLAGLFAGTFHFTRDLFKDQQLVHQTAGSIQKSIVLSDGSVVWLNSNARLTYPEQFDGKSRKVTLQGEAFFEIVKDPAKPFIVSTTKADVRVLGTSFNVNAGTDDTKVAVTTGTVRVNNTGNEDFVVVTAGFSARSDGQQVRSFVTANLNYNAWRTGVFTFREAPLSVIIRDLQTFYKTQIKVAPGLQADCGLTATFDNAPLEDIMEVLELTCHLSVIKTPEGFLIR